MDLSIVIPALNEAEKIGGDVRAAAEFIRDETLEGEVIVVDDGSTDGTGKRALTVDVPSGVERRVIRLEENQGKGAAVKAGILASEGDIVIFADSGTCVPYADARPAMEKIRSGRLDMALGSRRHKDTVILRDRSLKRKVFSWLFRQAAVLLVGVPRRFTDTQCGFKVYRGEAARDLFGRCVTRGFLFELEILLRALRRGYRVEEFPVEWTCDPDSRLRAGKAAASVVKELFRVRSLARVEERRGNRE